jgi:uncharacterized protein (TIGR00299 family) protein
MTAMVETLLHFDPGAGASGDMVLGALIDVGVPAEVIDEAVRKVGVNVTLEVRQERRHGVQGIKIRFVTPEGEPADPMEKGAGEADIPPIMVRTAGSQLTSPLRAHLELVQGARSSQAHSHHPWKDVERRIQLSPLRVQVRDMALSILRRLASAEAAVHGMPLEEVAFHEVAAADSLGDVVGSAAAICHLAPTRITCDAFGVGAGSIRMEHGVLPSPGPATGLMLIGAPVVGLSGRMETVTPTGAAILTTVSHAFGPPPPMTLRAQGHGLGMKDPPERANILRAWLGESGRQGARQPTSQVVMLETNLDDATPQHLAHALQQCLKAGAVDAWITPVVMKKGRPGFTLHALVALPDERTVVDVFFGSTPTLGVRRIPVERHVAARTMVEVQTRYGRVRLKTAHGHQKDLGAWPEHDDCAVLAEHAGVPLRVVEMAALRAVIPASRPPRSVAGTKKSKKRRGKP